MVYIRPGHASHAPCLWTRRSRVNTPRLLFDVSPRRWSGGGQARKKETHVTILFSKEALYDAGKKKDNSCKWK